MPEPGRVLTRQEVKNKRHGAASVLDKNRVKSGYAPRKHELAEQVIALARSHEQLRESHGKAREALTLIREGAESAKGIALLGLNESALSAGEETP